jgi:hypothetical protein
MKKPVERFAVLRFCRFQPNPRLQSDVLDSVHPITQKSVPSVLSMKETFSQVFYDLWVMYSAHTKLTLLYMHSCSCELEVSLLSPETGLVLHCCDLF